MTPNTTISTRSSTLVRCFVFPQDRFKPFTRDLFPGYMVAQIPGHYLMQKLPLGRFVTISVFLWSVVVFLHCTAKSYGGLIPLRFFLGFFESCLVPAMEVTSKQLPELILTLLRRTNSYL